MDLHASLGKQPSQPASISGTLDYEWQKGDTLEETDSPAQSASPYWWLNSGGELFPEDGYSTTIQGDLPKSDRWYEDYSQSDQTDTDGGAHPQNLFRLVSRSTWKNVRIETSFYIVNDNLSDSDQRYESNGLLLMSRYAKDGQTLYYAGVRVDGTAVIKKKFHGDYYTMAQTQVFPGSYDRTDNPNLLPHDTWIYLRSETVTNADDSVNVRLYMQENNEWVLLLEARDDGGATLDHSAPITSSGFVGIRTDFMDVKFGAFHAQEL